MTQTPNPMPAEMACAPHVRTFGALHRYYQGPGAIALAGPVAAGLGREPLLVADALVARLIRPSIEESLRLHGLGLAWGEVTGDVTHPMIERLVAAALANGRRPDVVLAAGGGKGVDSGKAVARELGARLIVLPTSASNDGPCSKAFVFYDECHRMLSVEHLCRSPDAVIVDTQIVAKAPPALLVSGIGDALCKLYEGRQVRMAGGANLFGGGHTVASEQIALACERVIRQDAAAGLAAAAGGNTDASFERLVESLVLLSGLAFENSGLSIAHSMTRGLTRLRHSAAALHGQQVGYGLLVQFVLERRSHSFMEEQIRFHRSVGLAASLHELCGQAPDHSDFTAIAEGVMTSPHLSHFERPLTAADFEAAMLHLEELSHHFDD